MTITKIANGYTVSSGQLGTVYFCNNLDEVLVRLKVAFGEMYAPEMTFAFQALREADIKSKGE